MAFLEGVIKTGVPVAQVMSPRISVLGEKIQVSAKLTCDPNSTASMD
jgi:hypothetical protein